MKTDKITVNKSDDRPDGVEIDLVQPESKMEEGVLTFLLTSFLRDAKAHDRIPYELPDNFMLTHQGKGSFVVSGFKPQEQDNPTYYQPPRPIAVVGVAQLGNRFDVIHAEVPANAQPPAPVAKKPEEKEEAKAEKKEEKKEAKKDKKKAKAEAKDK